MERSHTRVPLHRTADPTLRGPHLGALLERIDIHVEVPAVRFNELRGKNVPDGESSEAIRDRVLRASEIQRERRASEGIFANASMSPRQIRQYSTIDSHCEALLERAMVRQGLSARAHDRILKVTRTIADLDASPKSKSAHIAEAVGYRSLDRTYWT